MKGDKSGGGSFFDTLVRGASVVSPEGVRRADLGIAEGRIVAMESSLSGRAREEIDLSGCHLFPGFIDAHVHFNEPGREHWEGLQSGSLALAAGGGTAFFDMPLNSDPPVLDGVTFREKAARAAALSWVDYALWGGLTPQNLDRLEELADCGVIGYKAFMSGSGIDAFPRADLPTLRRGMKIAAARGLVVAVHAEDEEMVARLAAECMAAGHIGIDDYLASRPVAAEVRAVQEALALAAETGCALHIVHVSSSEAVEEISAAKKRGVQVTAETCPHYLLLTDEAVRQQGAVAKCAPPLRSERCRQELWQRMRAGMIDTLGSDHSPAPPELKKAANFFSVWGGISGCQHGLILVAAEIFHRGQGEAGFVQFAELTSANVAKRFGITNKGHLAVGYEADFVAVDFQARAKIVPEELHYRHRQSPYLGRECAAVIRETRLRGQRVYPMKSGEKKQGRLLLGTGAVGN